MLGKFFARSAFRQTQQIMMSVYGDKKVEIDVQYKLKSHICLKRGVSEADMTFSLSSMCCQKHIVNFVI